MYYPIIRGKQFDLLALRELVENHLLSPFVCPIIEPVKDAAGLPKMLATFVKAEQPLAIIINPQVGNYGQLTTPLHPIQALFTAASLMLVGIVTDDFNSPSLLKVPTERRLLIANQVGPLKHQPDLLTTYQPTAVILPDEFRIRRRVSYPKILQTDPYQAERKTADFANHPDDFFSDDYLFAADEDFVGTSDFSFDGDYYSDKGYPQNAIALHYFYVETDGSLWLHHFVSDSNDTWDNPGGKFFEALGKLAQWLAKHPDKRLRTFGTQQLLNYQDTKKFPGLGTIKKLLLMHALELRGVVEEEIRVNR